MRSALRLALALFLLASPGAFAQVDLEGPPRCLTVPVQDGIYTHRRTNPLRLVVVEGCVAALEVPCGSTPRLEVYEDTVELHCWGGPGEVEEERVSYRASRGGLLLMAGKKPARLQRHPLPPGTLVERLRSPEGEVAAAATERALARQTDPAVCTALGALVREASVPAPPSREDTSLEAQVRRVVAGAREPCLQAAMRETLGSGGPLVVAVLGRLSELTEDASQQLGDLLRVIDSGKVPGLNTLPARRHPLLVSELSARVARGAPLPAALASAHLLASLTWDERRLGRDLLGLAANSPSCEVRAALLHGLYAQVGSGDELVTLYQPLLSSEGRATAHGTPKDCAQAHAKAASNLAWRLRELYPIEGQSDPQAWALLIGSLQGPEAEVARERVTAIFHTMSRCLRRPDTAPPEAFERLLAVLGRSAC